MSSTYSFLTVQATISGPGGIVDIGSTSGAADEGVTVNPAKRNNMATGASKDVMHSLQAQKSGTISIQLLKTSKTNEQLSLMQALQQSAPSLHGINIITVRDSARDDLVTATNVAFTGPPTLRYSKDGGMNVWEFDCGQIDEFLGA